MANGHECNAIIIASHINTHELGRSFPSLPASLSVDKHHSIIDTRNNYTYNYVYGYKSRNLMDYERITFHTVFCSLHGDIPSSVLAICNKDKLSSIIG
jgi:hypothetical protein